MKQTKERKYNVLYVDDEEINLRMFRRAFGQDFNLHTTTSGKQGLSLFKKEHIDFVIADHRMPEMSGTEFLKSISEIDPNLKTVLLTGFADIDILEEAINKVGVWRYLSKPYDIADLRDTITTGAEINLLTREKNKALRDLQHESEQLQLSALATKIGYFAWTFPGKNAHWDNNMKKLFGMEAGEKKSNLEYFYSVLHPEDKERIAKGFENTMRAETVHLSDVSKIEYRIILPDGKTRHIESSSLFFGDHNGNLERIAGACMDITDRKETEEKYLQAMFTGQEKERERISRELHDGLGQILTAAKLSISATMNQMPESDTNKEIIEDVGHLIESARKETKRISKNLLPPVLVDYGLNAAVSKLVQELKTLDKVNIDFVHPKKFKRLEKLPELMLYRMIQEAVSNALQHGKAEEGSIAIAIDEKDKKITVEIFDNGIGFIVDNTGEYGGLSNMKQRAGTIGASFDVKSNPNQGTTVTIVYYR